MVFHDCFVSWLYINDHFIFVLLFQAEPSAKAIAKALAKALAKEKVSISWCFTIVLFHDCKQMIILFSFYYFRHRSLCRWPWQKRRCVLCCFVSWLFRYMIVNKWSFSFRFIISGRGQSFGQINRSMLWSNQIQDKWRGTEGGNTVASSPQDSPQDQDQDDYQTPRRCTG